MFGSAFEFGFVVNRQYRDDKAASCLGQNSNKTGQFSEKSKVAVSGQHFNCLKNYLFF